MRNFFTVSSIMVAVVIMSSGCVKEKKAPPLYVWGNYQYTSSAYGMFDKNPEVVDRHLQELEVIMNDSDAKDQRVAPGIYAEYGQILYENSKRSDAKRYFLLEKNTYPESSLFIDRVLIDLYGDKQ